MADQVTVGNEEGQGDDYVVSTDDAGASGHVQRVKLTQSADGSATHVQADSDGLLVNLGTNNDVTVTGTVAVTQSGTWDEVGINDSGNSITVDDGGGSVTVDGTVGVSGTVAVTQSGTWDEVGINDSGNSITVDDGGTTLSVDDGGGSLTVDGTLTTTPSGDHTVVGKAADGAAVSGNPVLVGGQDGTNVQSLKTDSTGSLQVDVESSALPSGAATSANQSTIIGHVDGIEGLLTTIDADTGTLAGAVAGTEMQVDVVTMPTVAVTQSGTWDEVGINDSGNSITVDDGGSTISVDDGAGSLTVDGTVAISSLPASTNTVEVVGDAAHDAAVAGNPVLIGAEFDDTTPDSVDEGDVGRLRISANRNLFTTLRDAAGNERGANVTAGNALVVDGSAATQPVSHAALTELAAAIDTELQVDVVGALPAGNNNIGDVDIASLPNEGQQTMANSISVAIASNQSAVAVDGSAVTQPVSHAALTELAAAIDTELQVDIVGALPAGTNAIGKLAANSGVDIGDVDVTSVAGTVTTKETRSGTATCTQVADTASSTTVLASNANRLNCSIQNTSSAVLYIKCGTTASATDFTARLVQYAYWEPPTGNIYTGRIDGIWASDPGDGAAVVTEFT